MRHAAKGCCAPQGIEVRAKWWQPKAWKELKTHPRLKTWMEQALQAWRSKLLAAEAEQQELRRQVEALAPVLLPKGVGAYSAVALEYEMKGLASF